MERKLFKYNDNCIACKLRNLYIIFISARRGDNECFMTPVKLGNECTCSWVGDTVK